MAHTTGSHPYLAHKADTIDTIAPRSFASCDPYIQLQFNEKRCQLSRHKNTDSIVVLMRVLELTGDASPAISVYLRQCPVAATPARTIACFEEGGDRAGQRLRRGASRSGVVAMASRSCYGGCRFPCRSLRLWRREHQIPNGCSDLVAVGRLTGDSSTAKTVSSSYCDE
jgi:hypothetical protein